MVEKERNRYLNLSSFQFEKQRAPSAQIPAAARSETGADAESWGSNLQSCEPLPCLSGDVLRERWSQEVEVGIEPRQYNTECRRLSCEVESSLQNSEVTGQVFGTVVKLPFGVPASHIAVSGFVFCSTSASSFPVVQALREQVVTWGECR